jgi:hypothetical protein
LALGDLHIATKDGEAMFFHDSIDFSTYAGTDGGSTPYRLVFTDSAGKNAVAYGGAAGGGEALGVELVTNGDCEDITGWNHYGSTSLSLVADERPGGSGSQSIEVERIDSGDSFVYQNFSSEYGNSLIKLSGWLKNISSTKILFFAGAWPSVPSPKAIEVTSTDWTDAVGFFTLCPYRYLSILANLNNIGDKARFDDISAKKLTDVPASGLHLMSAKNGTTRNMTSVETGFNPNAISGVKIYG